MIHSKPTFKTRCENYIAGKWTPPVDGNYFSNNSPVDGADFCEIPRSDGKDIDLAVEAAWTKTSATERSRILNKVAVPVFP